MPLPNYATRPLYNYATMPLVHLALQSKCKLKDHNRWLHLRQSLATETILANHSGSCETRFCVERVYIEKCWREVMTAQVYCVSNSKNLANCCFPPGLLAFFCPKSKCNHFGVNWAKLGPAEKNGQMLGFECKILDVQAPAKVLKGKLSK